MTRKTLLFGNGLGMSLCPSSYSLERALSEVWTDQKSLNPAQKKLISDCLPTGSPQDRPTGEDDLDRLQQVLAACEVLQGNKLPGGLHWLSEHGQAFPDAIHRYIHSVAVNLFSVRDGKKPYRLPTEFTSPLCDFVRTTASHVATLNYDGLLDHALTKNKLLKAGSGALLDGFNARGFNRTKLFRTSSTSQGWFLHLHGSPLYFEDEAGTTKKLKEIDLLKNAPLESSHIVLTHVRHKLSVILASDILTTYWEFLERAFDESEEIVIFGYSGADSHLNEMIVSKKNDVKVRVVEWLGAGSQANRVQFWRNVLHDGVVLQQMESVFSFSDW